MKKRKILGFAIAAIISMTTIVPAFAEDTTVDNSTANTNTTQVQENQISKEEKITKLTERAKKLGIDITGLSKEEIKAKFKEVREAKKQAFTEKLQGKAYKLGVDITGLNNKEAKEKIKETREAKKATKTSTAISTVQ